MSEEEPVPMKTFSETPMGGEEENDDQTKLASVREEERSSSGEEREKIESDSQEDEHERNLREIDDLQDHTPKVPYGYHRMKKHRFRILLIGGCCHFWICAANIFWIILYLIIILAIVGGSTTAILYAECVSGITHKEKTYKIKGYDVDKMRFQHIGNFHVIGIPDNVDITVDVKYYGKGKDLPNFEVTHDHGRWELVQKNIDSVMNLFYNKICTGVDVTMYLPRNRHFHLNVDSRPISGHFNMTGEMILYDFHGSVTAWDKKGHVFIKDITTGKFSLNTDATNVEMHDVKPLEDVNLSLTGKEDVKIRNFVHTNHYSTLLSFSNKGLVSIHNSNFGNVTILRHGDKPETSNLYTRFVDFNNMVLNVKNAKVTVSDCKMRGSTFATEYGKNYEVWTYGLKKVIEGHEHEVVYRSTDMTHDDNAAYSSVTIL